MSITDLETPPHHCVETIEQIYSSRPDPKDEPVLNLDGEWFTDGNSFIDKGLRRTGYAIVSISDVTDMLYQLTPLPQKQDLLSLLEHDN